MLEIKNALGAVVGQQVEMKFLEAWNENGDFEIKFTAGEEEGVIEGYASIFGERDRIDDIVMRGAFSKTLASRKAKHMPMLVSHAQRIPVGVWDEMREDSKGLKVRGRIDIKSEDGGQLYRVAKMGAELGISIGYKTIRADYEVRDGDQVRLLNEVDLYECSIVTIPCCDGARVTSVKQAPLEPRERTVEKAALKALQAKAVEIQVADGIRRAIAAMQVK